MNSPFCTRSPSKAYLYASAQGASEENLAIFDRKLIHNAPKMSLILRKKSASGYIEKRFHPQTKKMGWKVGIKHFPTQFSKNCWEGEMEIALMHVYVICIRADVVSAAPAREALETCFGRFLQNMPSHPPTYQPRRSVWVDLYTLIKAMSTENLVKVIPTWRKFRQNSARSSAGVGAKVS